MDRGAQSSLTRIRLCVRITVVVVVMVVVMMMMQRRRGGKEVVRGVVGGGTATAGGRTASTSSHGQKMISAVVAFRSEVGVDRGRGVMRVRRGRDAHGASSGGTAA